MLTLFFMKAATEKYGFSCCLESVSTRGKRAGVSGVSDIDDSRQTGLSATFCRACTSALFVR